MVIIISSLKSNKSASNFLKLYWLATCNELIEPLEQVFWIKNQNIIIPKRQTIHKIVRSRVATTLNSRISSSCFFLFFFRLLLLLFVYISKYLFLGWLGWLLKPNVHRMFFKFLWRRSKIQLFFIHRPSMIDKQKKNERNNRGTEIRNQFRNQKRTKNDRDWMPWLTGWFSMKQRRAFFSYYYLVVLVFTVTAVVLMFECNH